MEAKMRFGIAKKIMILIALLALFCIVGFAVISINMRPAMGALATARIKAVSARAMNDAILDSMGDEKTYANLIEARDDGAHVYMIQADTRKMNLLAAECAQEAQDRIALIGEQGIGIPLGTVTGIAFFAGKGPLVNVKFTPAGSVQSRFASEFISTGINQSLYRVKLHLISSVKLVMPGVHETISVEAEAAIAENILIGDVPQVYTNVDDTEDMLNLVPTEVP